MIKKRRGARGQPCLTPRSILKGRELRPFTLIAAFASTSVSLTKPMKDGGKPILDMMLKRSSQSTLSKAFEKSSLRKMESCLDFLAHVRVSCVSKILSRMNLFLK